jgi:signal peptidase
MNAQTREDCERSIAIEVLRSTGKLQLRVTGTSMLPTLWPGDLLSIQSKHVEPVQPGEVVLFQRENRLFIHRVVRSFAVKGQHLFITRGDCMPQTDPAITEQHVLGKVMEIQRGQTTMVPRAKLSFLNRLVGRTLAHCDLLQRIALRLRAPRHDESGFGVTDPEATS